jgi:putative ABC transport system permease protein
MKIFDQLGENIGIAIDAMRASKLRSGLTVLGVMIGVSTVMAMATIVRGIQDQIVRAVEVAGPTTFYVFKVFSQTPLNPDALPKWVRIRPDLTLAEAERVAALPEINYAGLWAITIGRLEYGGVRTQPNRIYGADDRFTEILGGELVIGRWFTRSEMGTGASVTVLSEDYARRLFGRLNPIGKTIRAAGRPVEVIGLYTPASNIFQPPGAETAAILPYRTLEQQYTIDKTGSLFIAVKPKKGVTVDQAQNAATVALREQRRLHPSDKNTFDFVTQEQILDIFNSLTSAFFGVMIALSSVGLMVGGIGVMAIMMVSVTNRTREIGVRKAMGATRRDIMLQFLIEAATLTGIGGVIGIAMGLGVGRLANYFLKVSAPAPLSLTIVAVVVSIAIGITFGIIPARRAARLNPVDALRYE